MPRDVTGFSERTASARRRAAGSSSRRWAMSFTVIAERLRGGSRGRTCTCGRKNKLATNSAITIVLVTDKIQPRWLSMAERRLLASKKTGGRVTLDLYRGRLLCGVT